MLTKSEKEFDLFVFARRDIKNAIIPAYIKHIIGYSFSDCKNLKSVQFIEK